MEQKSTKQLVIVIPVFNQCQFTENLLPTIEAQDKGRYDLIHTVVVNNHSVDNTAYMLEAWGSYTKDEIIPGFQRHVITNPANYGFVRACNIGINFTKALGKNIDVMLLNNDMRLLPDCIVELSKTLYSAIDVGIVGGRLFFPNGDVQHGGAFLGANGHGVHIDTGPRQDRFTNTDTVKEVEYVTGALFLIKSDILENVDGLDDSFAPAYFEEVDLCYTARGMGYKTLYNPRATAIHYENVTGKEVLGDIKSIQESYSDINQVTFYKKWEGREYAFTSNDRILISGKIYGTWSFSIVLRGIAKGLSRAGVDVSIAPEEYHNPQHMPDWEIKQMIDKPNDYWNRVALRSSEGDHMYLLPAADKRVAHTTGESSVVPKTWIDQLNNVDQVITTSTFFKKVLQESGVKSQVDVLPNSIDFEHFTKSDDVLKVQDLRGLNFYSNFFFGQRKDPETLLDGFVDAFDEKDDVTLTLHAAGIHDVLQRTYGLTVGQWIEKVLDGRPHAPILVNPTHVPHSQLPAYMRNYDVHVTTTHAEGFGLPVVELASCGIPTITTGYSGVTDFVNKETGWLLDYKMVDIPLQKVPYFRNYIGGKWAQVKKDSLISTLREVKENPASIRSKGIASRIKSENYSIDSIGIQAKHIIF